MVGREERQAKDEGGWMKGERIKEKGKRKKVKGERGAFGRWRLEVGGKDDG
jgi:hypothetical protein